MTGDLPTTLVDVETTARYLGVSKDCVYANADALGARRIGKGPKARLRFNLAELDVRLQRQPLCVDSREP